VNQLGILTAVFIFTIWAGAQTNSTSSSTNSNFCDSTRGLDEIKSYLVCQSSPSLLACSGLVTAVNGHYISAAEAIGTPAVGSQVSTKMQKLYDEAIQKGKPDFIRKLSEEFDRQWLAKQEKVPPSEINSSKALDPDRLYNQRAALGDRLSQEQKYRSVARGVEPLRERIQEIKKKLAAKEVHNGFTNMIGEVAGEPIRSKAEPKDERYRKLKLEKAEIEKKLGSIEDQLSKLAPSDIKAINKELAEVKESREKTFDDLEKKRLTKRAVTLKKQLQVAEAQVDQDIKSLPNMIEGLRERSSFINESRRAVRPPANDNVPTGNVAESTSSIPKNISDKNTKAAEAVFEKLQDHLKNSHTVSDDFVKKSLQDVLKENLGDLTKSGQVQTSSFDSVEIAPEFQKLLSVVHTQLEKAMANRLGAGASEAALSAMTALGRESPLVVGGEVSAAALGGTATLGASIVAQVVLTPASGGCEELGANSINTESGSCRESLQVNAPVWEFLNSPEEKQKESLKTTPRICSFYEHLHHKFLKDQQPVSLECGAQGFSLTTKSDDGTKLTHEVLYDSQRKIKQINMRKNGSYYGNYPFNPDNTLMPSLAHNPEHVRRINALKVYIVDADDCCKAADEDHARCLNQYNAGNTKAQSPADRNKTTH
jgi:hypothetical protein